MQPSSAIRFYNLRELEELARPRIPKSAFDFYSGGAEDLASVRYATVAVLLASLVEQLSRLCIERVWSPCRENEVAFSRYKLLPRMLVDVSTIDTSTTLLGATREPLEAEFAGYTVLLFLYNPFKISGHQMHQDIRSFPLTAT